MYLQLTSTDKLSEICKALKEAWGDLVQFTDSSTGVLTQKTSPVKIELDEKQRALRSALMPRPTRPDFEKHITKYYDGIANILQHYPTAGFFMTQYYDKKTSAGVIEHHQLCAAYNPTNAPLRKYMEAIKNRLDHIPAFKKEMINGNVFIVFDDLLEPDYSESNHPEYCSAERPCKDYAIPVIIGAADLRLTLTISVHYRKEGTRWVFDHLVRNDVNFPWHEYYALRTPYECFEKLNTKHASRGLKLLCNGNSPLVEVRKEDIARDGGLQGIRKDTGALVNIFEYDPSLFPNETTR